MSSDLKQAFSTHIDKIQRMQPRKHMMHGLPYFVEKVTKQARLVYQIFGEDIVVLRCFSAHKDYERWYRSYK
jgi:Txe/YoeB family toxin of Txe-Axe toxin-antitoxin module